MIAQHELTLKASYGQSFVFFVQVKAAINNFALSGICGGCDSLYALTSFSKNKRLGEAALLPQALLLTDRREIA